VSHGNRVSAGAVGRRPGRRAATVVASDKDETRTIRDWAQAKGFDIAARGRIKQDIVDAYHRAGGR